MRSRPLDTFEEWLATPMDEPCADPRFVVRRADLSDFERIYDTVDEAFGHKRPRAVYDWLYRQSPLGPARCWILVEKATGDVVNASGRVPWPLARGDAPIEGAMLADDATLRRWQRQGLGDLRRPARRADAWRQRSAAIYWPNENTRARLVKRGRADSILGPLSRWVLPLRTSGHLHSRYGIPKPLAPLAGGALDLALGVARSVRMRGRRVQVEELAAFDDAFDAITWKGMAAPHLWCPHDAEFLNWRYAANPAQEYACYSAVTNDAPCGYAVVRIAPVRAVLMELVFPPGAPDVAHALIRRAAKTARGAGCPQLDFEITPSWPHAPILQRAGFIAAPSNIYVNAYSRRIPRDQARLEFWQLVPGDQDAL